MVSPAIFRRKNAGRCAFTSSLRFSGGPFASGWRVRERTIDSRPGLPAFTSRFSSEHDRTPTTPKLQAGMQIDASRSLSTQIRSLSLRAGLPRCWAARIRYKASPFTKPIHFIGTTSPTGSVTSTKSPAGPTLRTAATASRLTFRIARGSEDQPPAGAATCFRTSALRIQQRQCADPGHCMNLNGPIQVGADTELHAVLLIEDPQPPEARTVHGALRFVQLVGITAGRGADHQTMGQRASSGISCSRNIRCHHRSRQKVASQRCRRCCGMRAPDGWRRFVVRQTLHRQALSGDPQAAASKA